jgi:hypothetical protein
MADKARVWLLRQSGWITAGKSVAVAVIEVLGIDNESF